MPDSLIQEFLDNGGRIIHRKNGRRRVTIAYTRADGVIQYGGTIHRQDNPSEHWNRHAHIRTAIGRCTVRPVVLADVDCPTVERERMIRRSLAVLGCKGDRISQEVLP